MTLHYITSASASIVLRELSRTVCILLVLNLGSCLYWRKRYIRPECFDGRAWEWAPKDEEVQFWKNCANDRGMDSWHVRLYNCAIVQSMVISNMIIAPEQFIMKTKQHICTLYKCANNLSNQNLLSDNHLVWIILILLLIYFENVYFFYTKQRLCLTIWSPSIYLWIMPIHAAYKHVIILTFFPSLFVFTSTPYLCHIPHFYRPWGQHPVIYTYAPDPLNVM